VDMHATDLVGINGITRVLLVYTCQQDVYPRGHVLPLRFKVVIAVVVVVAVLMQRFQNNYGQQIRHTIYEIKRYYLSDLTASLSSNAENL
jgi:hypothetical protein